MYFMIVYVYLYDMYECIGGHLLYVGFPSKACILYLVSCIDDTCLFIYLLLDLCMLCIGELNEK